MSKILVIEDDEAIRENIELLLDAEGYEISVAKNGEEGVKMALADTPDLIVCDVMMPKMTGHDVIEALRAKPQTALTPFIFLTAKADKRDMRQGMVLGADDYLTKPFARMDLLMAVSSRLERTRLMREFLAAEQSEMRKRLLREIPDSFGNLLNALMCSFDLLVEEQDPVEKERHRADGRKAIAELYAIWLANLRAMGSGNRPN